MLLLLLLLDPAPPSLAAPHLLLLLLLQCCPILLIGILHIGDVFKYLPEIRTPCDILFRKFHIKLCMLGEAEALLHYTYSCSELLNIARLRKAALNTSH